MHLSTIGGDDDFKANLKNMTKAGDDVEKRARVPHAAQGRPAHRSPSAFLERSTALNPLRLQPFIRSSNDTLDTIGHPHLDTFTLTGPFNPTGPGDTPSRRRIFVCRPPGNAQADEDACARRIISTLARRAYRGLVDARPTSTGCSSSTRRAASTATFERGIQMALQRMLASPKFVFRVERDPAGAAPGAVYRVSDLELASRLSFFLWSSIPDDQLLQAARLGHAAHAGGAEPAGAGACWPIRKSQALVDNFAGQWLYLRNLKNLQPNSIEFPDFDDNLRTALADARPSCSSRASCARTATSST